MVNIAHVPAAVDEVLAKYFEANRPALDAIYPAVAHAGDVLADFALSGGKRVRPTFVYAGWQCGSPDAADEASDETMVLRIGAAIELIQACALIHDDILDRSDTRRGSPTAHRRFESLHIERGFSGDPAHYGVSAAILLGDLALAWADDLVHGIGPVDWTDMRPLPRPVGVLWSQMRTEVLGGQLLDITNESSGDESITAAYRVMEYKTAAYTVARPLQLGAALAGADDALLAGLHRIGLDLGVAFQLRDDVLGVFGDPAQTGKPSGDDLVEGKRTALLAEGLQRASDAGSDLLRASIGRDLTDLEVTGAREVLVDSGALTAVEEQIDACLDRALTAIDALPVTEPARTDLTWIARRITHREK
ncbi:polyprenyl synthetase family protein [Gordonia sp. (in: high G+C Gram-positive bacteria)]|uniref:polyprenyl synthetase family protein n=1 Tax=Gordonia sp. (in: high G+C Gram-positive bacteria) TaxID=84139 RepID=UPI00169919FC|nr:polyprenyl synthetase family protein [Gordonia sp. (in: high G+C Gram-positive bacteria)]NLG44935.1 polyprenyl synthetase family protein [Gordonia sp. (in: high G+C Gram-positive bacteria)]